MPMMATPRPERWQRWAGGPALLLACACGAEVTPARGPNLILVSIDSLRADHLGCYGYGRDTSPFLDRLAAEGARFEEAVSTTSWTLPAHAAMFTGLVDTTHGVVDNGLALSGSHLTLAEVLKRRGYQTAGFYGGPYLHPTFGLAQGFDRWQSCMSAMRADLGTSAVRAAAMDENGASHDDVTGPRTLAEVRSWLAGGVHAPVFLFLHMWDVHYDYVPPPEYVERFDPGYDGPVDGRGVAVDESIAAGMDPRDRAHLVACYDGEIRFTDDILERIFEELRGAGLLEDAVVVVTADHGEEFFEHGGKAHQRTLFDEVLRVPLIVWGPTRVPAGLECEEQVSLIDLMPTLARLGGVDEELAVQGRDLGPFLAGGELAPREALAELSVNDEALFARRTRGEKLIVDERAGTSVGFDLLRDPAEQNPLPASTTTPLDLLRRRAHGFQRFLGTRADAWKGNAELVETLRRLGYLGDG